MRKVTFKRWRRSSFVESRRRLKTFITSDIFVMFVSSQISLIFVSDIKVCSYLQEGCVIFISDDPSTSCVAVFSSRKTKQDSSKKNQIDDDYFSRKAFLESLSRERIVFIFRWTFFMWTNLNLFLDVIRLEISATVGYEEIYSNAVSIVRLWMRIFRRNILNAIVFKIKHASFPQGNKTCNSRKSFLLNSACNIQRNFMLLT